MKHVKGDAIGLLRPYVPVGATVIDVGANMGSVSAALAEMVGPTGTVYAIEPDERCWPTLERVPARMVKAACGSVAESRTFWQAHNTTQSTSWQALSSNGHAVSVQTIRLDTVTPQATAVKIDAQGSDLDVLKGATHLLGVCPVWVVEWWPFGLKAAGVDPMELPSFLWEHGLRVYWAEGREMTLESARNWLADGPSYVNITGRRG